MIFSNPLVQILILSTVIAGGFGAWLLVHDAKTKEAVITEITREAERIHDKAIEAGKPADKPGSAERLRKYHCRDCNLPR